MSEDREKEKNVRTIAWLLERAAMADVV